MKYQAIDSDYIREMKEYDEFMRDKKLLYKGLKYGYFVAILIIILSAFFSGRLVLAQASSVDLNFENGYAYNGSLPETPETINQRNATEQDGIYKAPYSFQNDTIGSDDPVGWVSENGANCFTSIINDIAGHNKVLMFNDSSGSNMASMKNSFLFAQTSGTIEFFVRLTGYRVSYEFYEGASLRVLLRFNNDNKFSAYSGGTFHPIFTYEFNRWYHIKITFNSLTDSSNIWVDGNDYSNFAFTSEATYLDSFNIRTEGAESGYYHYVDAIGYSWDGYYFYDFDDEGTGSTPIGFTQTGDAPATVETALGSNVIELHDTATNMDVGGYFELDSFHNKVIEFDVAKDSIYSSHGFDVELWTEGTMNIYLEFREDDLNYYDTSYHPVKEAFLSINTFYTIRLEINDSSNTFDVYVNDVLELDDGKFMYDTISTSDKLWIETWAYGLNYYCYFDNLDMYSLEGYNIGDNLGCGSFLTNDTETDKFEFTFDSSGAMNTDGDDSVNNFTDIENDYWNNDVVNIYPSIDDNADKCIRILGGQKGNVGIQRDFDTQDVNTSEVWWQLDLINMGYPENEIYTKIENDASEIIAYFKLNGSYIPYGYTYYADLCYYYDSEWIILQSYIKTNNNYNMTFCLNWTNGDDYGVLGFEGNNYNIPFDKDQDSLGLLQIYGINDHNVVFGNLNVKLDWLRIIINGNSISDELMPDNLFILSGNPFSLLTQSFIEITFDITIENNVSILLNNEVQILDYGLNLTADRVFFGNFYQDKSYSNLYLTIYNSSNYRIENIKIYGIQLINQLDPLDAPFLEFEYSGVDVNESYFYVNGNDLYYSLETDDNWNIEYIQATFDITDFACKNFAIAFTHDKSFTYLTSECKVVFTTDTYLSFISTETFQAESLILPQERIIKEIVFLITDDGNTLIDTSTGYFSEITLVYYPDIGTAITTLSLIEIIPLLILLTLIPIVIYYGFGRKTELIVPSLMLVSIFGTAINMIPLWLEVVILFSCVAYYIIRYERRK